MTTTPPPQEQQQDWSGWAMHVHHACESPIEYCRSYLERRRAILDTKPVEEHALRFARLQRVSSELPPAYVKARNAYNKAADAFAEAGVAYDKARVAFAEAGEDYDQARNAYVKARNAYVKARDAYVKARDAYNNAAVAALPILISIHERECTPTGCLWTPQHRSIFPGEVQL